MKLEKTALLSRALLGLILSVPIMAHAADGYSLQQVIDLAFNEHPSVRVAKAQEAAAIANVTTAKSFLNPEIEVGTGPSRYRSGSNDTRTNWGVALAQPLEFPDVRKARREIAESNVNYVSLNTEINQVELRSKVKQGFYQVVQRQDT